MDEAVKTYTPIPVGSVELLMRVAGVEGHKWAAYAHMVNLSRHGDTFGEGDKWKWEREHVAEFCAAHGIEPRLLIVAQVTLDELDKVSGNRVTTRRMLDEAASGGLITTVAKGVTKHGSIYAFEPLPVGVTISRDFVTPSKPEGVTNQESRGYKPGGKGLQRNASTGGSRPISNIYQTSIEQGASGLRAKEARAVATCPNCEVATLPHTLGAVCPNCNSVFQA